MAGRHLGSRGYLFGLVVYLRLYRQHPGRHIEVLPGARRCRDPARAWRRVRQHSNILLRLETGSLSDNGDLGTWAPLQLSLTWQARPRVNLQSRSARTAALTCLDRMNLGGVGNAIGGTGTGQSGSAATLHVTSNEIITAPALYKTPTATYVSFRGNGAGCTSGTGDLTTLKIVPGSPPSLAHSLVRNGRCGLAYCNYIRRHQRRHRMVARRRMATTNCTRLTAIRGPHRIRGSTVKDPQYAAI